VGVTDTGSPVRLISLHPFVPRFAALSRSRRALDLPQAIPQAAAQPENRLLLVQLHPGWAGAQPAARFYLPTACPLLSAPGFPPRAVLLLPTEAPAHFLLTQENPLPLAVAGRGCPGTGWQQSSNASSCCASARPCPRSGHSPAQPTAAFFYPPRRCETCKENSKWI